MADPTQYSFELVEVLEALIKQQGLSSGEWTLAVEFNFTAIMAGQAPSDVKPSALIQVSRIQLVQAGAATTPGLPIRDASKVNPTSKVTPKKGKAKS
jgi:hypothetical protein